jgi:hypothetical protein
MGPTPPRGRPSAPRLGGCRAGTPLGPSRGGRPGGAGAPRNAACAPGRPGPLMAPVPPGTGGGEGGARGGNGTGRLRHSLAAGAGVPAATGTTPAHGEERPPAPPRLNAAHRRTGTRGRPRARLQGIATEKGHDAQARRPQPRTRGLRAQRPERVGKTTPPGGDRSRGASRGARPSVRLPGAGRRIAVWAPGGSASPCASLRFLPRRCSRLGSTG